MDLDGAVQEVKHGLLDLIGPLIQGRVVVLTGSVVNNDALGDFFAEAGAREVRRVELYIETESPTHLRFSGIEALIADPPPSVQHLLDTIDPTINAIVYAGSFTAQSSFCGRKIIGVRQKSHFDAERKDRQQEYITAPICSKPYTIDLADTDDASRTVLAWVHRAPTIVSGIPEGYLALGSSHTYLIEKEQIDHLQAHRLSNLIQTIARDCRQAVLSTLDRGRPCTYYGYVSRRWIVDFGPFEALVYWNRKSWQLWAPGIVRPLLLDEAQCGAANGAVHAAARRLHENTGYTGAFCTDGMMQSDRYVIHEINPRVCAGFSLLAELCGGCLPLALIDLALRTRPAEADEVLRTPLNDLAPMLQRQEPVVKLWDAHLSPLQEELRSRANGMEDIAAWLAQVRQSLADEDLVSLADHD